MTTRINPDPHAEGFQWQATNSVTALLDNFEDLTSAISGLRKSGFSDDAVSVFMGQDGLAKLDIHGENHGLSARFIRAVESVTADQHPDRETEAALKEGQMYITVCTDGAGDLKAAAERALTVAHAHNIRYVGRWAVEHL